MPTPTPHDMLFRDALGRPEAARSFLSEYLPAELTALIDLSTLEATANSFVDDALREHQSDLLYHATLRDGTPAGVYILFEHKSYDAPLVALQLLRYMTRIWTQQHEASETLRPVLPLVVYHGDRRWRVATDFQALFPTLPAELRPYTPQFDYLLRDFSWRAELTLRGNLLVTTFLLTLRAAFAPAHRQELLAIAKGLARLERETQGLEIVRAILYYLTTATDRIDRDALHAALLQAGEQGVETLSTIAQQYYDDGVREGLERGLERGLEQGMEQGLEQGLRDSIMLLLTARFGHVSPELVGRLARIDDAVALRRLVTLAGTTASFNEFATALVNG